ncbi:MAG: mechanosensitive ion channel [Phycisphaerales bacterium]|nr:MAG: mechanosensitive ion channel [Phycisphaerales bacterium]
MACPCSLFGQPSQATVAGNTAEPNDPNAIKPTALVPAANAEAVAQLTVEQLQTRKKQATESPDLTDDVKAKLAEAYDRAIAQLKLAEELAARRKQYNQTAKTAPTALAETKDTLAQPAATALPEVPSDLTLAQAEQILAQATVALEDARKKATELENEPKRRADRRTKIPEESNAARRQLEEIQKKLDAAPAQEQASALTEINRIASLLQQRATEARLAANTEELLFYDATNDLLAGQRDMAARRVANQDKLVAFWQEKVSALRQQAAQAAKEEAARVQKQAQDAHPAIQEAAQTNADLAREQAALVNKIEKTSQYAAKIDEQLTALDKSFAEIKDQVGKAGGVTNVVGVRLLGKRSALPKTGDNRRRIKERPSEISQAQFEWIEYDGKWSDLSDIEQRADSLLEQAGALTEANRDAIREQLIEYLQTRRKILKALSDHSLDYTAKLANLDTKERALVKTTEAFANFIDANVLWVKSSDNLALADLRQTVAALAWLASPTNWRTAGAALWGDLKRGPSVYLLTALLVVAAFVLHARLHHRLETISENVRQIQTDSFLLTVQAFLVTLALAATWPVFLLLAAWRLNAVAADDFARALAAALFRVALVLFFLSFLQHLAVPHGLAQDHFRLRQEPLAFLRRHLRWFLILAVPVVFVLEAMEVQQVNDVWYGTVGRLFFVVGLVGLAVFLSIVLRPTAAPMDTYLKQRRGGWLDRLRYFWYPLCQLVPLSLVILAGMGYVYAARHLHEKWLITIGLILVVILIRALFVRGLTIAQRRLALLERQKRMAAAEQKSQENQDASAPPPSAETTEAKAKPEPTIFEMSQQTRRLIGAGTTILLVLGMWAIWNNVLPAFAKLGQYSPYAIGENPITLGEVVTALVVTILTVIVARNVPGLLEIIILRRLPLDRGIRFAIITICRYVLVVIGVVWAFTEIGIGWSKVQWLIAAMTVGLGFGLQEIFANFVSGLIILFEQPIRVDDIVTVGDVTGRVSMIKIRATTIRRWDQRELIVPNKEFITGQLINWTLSDSILRRDFAVGIAYGSDIRQAERLLYEIAENDARVLKDPAPIVLFKGFGDNSLDFELRVNYAGIENNLPLWHDINVAIDDRFREAGIEIAFPQRDVHVRSVDLDIPLHLEQPSPLASQPDGEPLR